MRALGLVLASLVLLAGCGDSDAPEAADGKPTATTSPSPSPLDEACDAMRQHLPESDDDEWRRLYQEAEHYAESDDAMTRALAYDLEDLLGPIVDAERDGASKADWDRITTDLTEGWSRVANRCGWPGINVS